MKKITMSGVVGWDFWPEQISKALDEAGGEDVNLIISSPGGLVSDALEIFNLVRNYEGKVTATLSGFAMSAASYIPLAANEVIAEDNAVYMIHNVHGGVWGDHNDILNYGEMCKGLSALMTKAYAKFTGKKPEELAELMDAETFFYGDQIVEAGFAHAVKETETEKDSESAMATAQLMFSETQSKLTADHNAIKKDLSRASAMALDIRAMKPTKKEEVNTMTLKELKEKYPDLVALIVDEAKAELEDSIREEARAEGATEERERIQAVHSQSFPGCEEIVTAAMFDGKSQAGDVAMQINARNIEAQKKAADDLSGDAPAPVDEPVHNGDLPESGPMTEEKAKKQWAKDKNLQAEFAGDFDVYFAYMREQEGVEIKESKSRGE